MFSPWQQGSILYSGKFWPKCFNLATREYVTLMCLAVQHFGVCYSKEVCWLDGVQELKRLAIASVTFDSKAQSLVLALDVASMSGW